MRTTLWANIVSPHLSPIVRELASIPGVSVALVAENELARERKANGWRVPDCSPARVVVRPTDAEFEELVRDDGDGTNLHLLNGLADVAMNRRVLGRLGRGRALVGLISESPDPSGIAGLARLAKYRADRCRNERNLDFILAMGQSGVRWYRSVGYDPERIFPFGYVTERPATIGAADGAPGESSKVRILFLGQVIDRKDGVTAIRALDGLDDLKWEFDIVGDGPDLPRWKRTAARSRVANRIRFRPPVDNRMVGHVLQGADFLLLPSKRDGWGAVVNEALMCGVPVVCSDRCGASDLLREPWRGSVFKSESVSDLRRVLIEWICRGKRRSESSARIREWSAVLEGASAAKYVMSVVDYVRNGGTRPSPPWY